MIKLLHCADLHLDSPLTALDVRRAGLRRNELRAALTSLTLSAKMNAADFLIISGDLFDSTRVSRDTVELLRREFAVIGDTIVIIAPGNHDPYTHASYYRRTEFSDNVYIFDSPELSCFDFPEKNTTVYGWAFTSDSMERAPLGGFTVENPSRVNILAAHADLDKTSSYCPVTSAELARCGFDYAALGHQHTHNGVMTLGRGYAAYAGCLEPRGFDELGPKGAVLVAAEKTDSLKFAAKFVRFGKRRYESEALDLTGARSNADAVGRIEALLSEKHYGDDTALRLRLTGNVADDFRLAPAFLAEQFPQLFLLEVIDETLPLLDADKLSADPTLRGAFYRSLAPMLASPDESERETAARALRYGLTALAGSDITDI
ncbi:MAG: DNA repair exonuclease [Clostridia bacterium]|nr:DNA repair exonuclease [Clostridia bacterium]